MEEEKLMEDEAKKQKERNNEVGGQNFTPPPHTHSLTQQKLSQLNVNLPAPLKKNSNFRFHGQNSKVQNFRFQIKNFLVPKS